MDPEEIALRVIVFGLSLGAFAGGFLNANIFGIGIGVGGIAYAFSKDF